MISWYTWPICYRWYFVIISHSTRLISHCCEPAAGSISQRLEVLALTLRYHLSIGFERLEGFILLVHVISALQHLLLTCKLSCCILSLHLGQYLLYLLVLFIQYLQIALDCILIDHLMGQMLLVLIIDRLLSFSL